MTETPLPKVELPTDEEIDKMSVDDICRVMGKVIKELEGTKADRLLSINKAMAKATTKVHREFFPDKGSQ